MLTIYFARHGQTAHSRENSFCGSLDVDLTPDGERMALAIAEHYGHIPFKALYASDKRRAQATAKPMAELLKLKVNTDPGLAEIAYGEWEGLSEDEVHSQRPDAFNAWSDHPDVVGPPGGETAYQIASRASGAIQRIRTSHPDGSVMVFSHKATLRILMCHFLGVPVGEFRRRIAMPVGAVSAVEFKSTGPLLKFLADTSHIPPELRSAKGT
jgi:probable phosphoglycerate mutase